MIRIRSFWNHIGKQFIVSGLFLFVVFLLAFLYENSSSKSFAIFIMIVYSLVFFIVGIVLLFIGIIGDKKLQRLKRNGIAYTPVRTSIQHSYAWNLSKHAYINDTYKAFSVKCVLNNSKGIEIVFKSRKLAVYKGWYGIMPQSATTAYDAMVYVNPNKTYDYAVDVWPC